MKKNAVLVLLLCFGLSSLCFCETLRPRLRRDTPKPKEKPDPEAYSQHLRAETQEKQGSSSRISILLVTPLVSENFYEGRFKAFGNHLLYSFPLGKIGDKVATHFELGAGFTVAKLTLSQPVMSFTHWYFLVPLRFRILVPVSQKVWLEGGLGAVFRPFEKDDRPTADGGFHSVSASTKFEADGFIGLLFQAGDSLFIRTNFGYLYATVGVEFLL